MKPLRLAIAALAAATLAAAPASAATPESGTVSAAAPEARWQGEAGGYLFTAMWLAAEDMLFCEAPFCDTYTLEVAEPGDLSITLQDNAGIGFVALEVTKPDGSTVYNSGAEADPTKQRFPNAEAGTYVLNISTNAPAAGIDSGYLGKAALVTAGGAPAPAAPTGEPAPPGDETATLALRTRSVKARKARKQLRLVLDSSGPVQDVSVELYKKSKRLAGAAVDQVDGRTTVKLKLGKRLRKGTYSVVLEGRTGDGGMTGTEASLKVR